MWGRMSWWGRMEAFMKPGRSTVLAEQRREASERSASLKRAFECCGTECSQRKRFKPGFSVEAGEGWRSMMKQQATISGIIEASSPLGQPGSQREAPSRAAE